MCVSRYGWMRVPMCALKAVGVSVRLAPAQLGPALARSLLPGRKLQGRGQMTSQTQEQAVSPSIVLLSPGCCRL